MSSATGLPDGIERRARWALNEGILAHLHVGDGIQREYHLPHVVMPSTVTVAVNEARQQHERDYSILPHQPTDGQTTIAFVQPPAKGAFIETFYLLEGDG